MEGTIAIIAYLLVSRWDEIIDQFPNFNGAAVKVWTWISDFILHFIGCVIAYLWYD